MVGCKSSEKKNSQEFAVKEAREYSMNTEGVIEVAPSTMIKDAIRLQGEIEKIKSTSKEGNSYVLVVKEIVKYGPTFASVEPKVGDKVMLDTQADVQFKSGDKVLIDVITPRTKNGDMLTVIMVKTR